MGCAKPRQSKVGRSFDRNAVSVPRCVHWGSTAPDMPPIELQKSKQRPTIVPSPLAFRRREVAGLTARCAHLDGRSREDCQMSKSLLKLGVLGVSTLTFTLVVTTANAQDKGVGR